MEQNYEIYHHGIKGMRWGIRKDKTRLGRKRDKTKDWSDDAKSASKLGAKNIKQLSNSELKKLNERARLEQEYSRLNPSAVKRGVAVAAGLVGTMGTAVALYNTGSQIVKIGKSAVEKIDMFKGVGVDTLVDMVDKV